MLKNFIEMVRKMEFVVLDTETTGIRNAQVCQIAVVNAFGKVLIDTLVKPSVPIPPDATRIHGISDRDVSGALNWLDIAPAVFDIVYGRDLIIYNSSYDLEVLQFSDRCWGMFETNWNSRVKSHCAMLQFAAYRGLWNLGKGGYRWHKLEDACKYMRVVQNDAHTALGDAEATRRLVLAMAASPKDGLE